MKFSADASYIEQALDSYIKKTLKYAARYCYARIKKLGERETSFSGLSGKEISGIAAVDEYFTDEHIFDILGESVGVSDAVLADALTALPNGRREIVLMSYFFGMTDRKIAESLNMARSTVTYRRASALKKLKKILENEG